MPIETIYDPRFVQDPPKIEDLLLAYFICGVWNHDALSEEAKEFLLALSRLAVNEQALRSYHVSDLIELFRTTPLCGKKWSAAKIRKLGEECQKHAFVRILSQDRLILIDPRDRAEALRVMREAAN
jgi:hypothetical protein